MTSHNIVKATTSIQKRYRRVSRVSAKYSTKICAGRGFLGRQETQPRDLVGKKLKRDVVGCRFDFSTQVPTGRDVQSFLSCDEPLCAG